MSEQVPQSFFRQSAVIPYRDSRDGIEVLLITTRKRKRWILPKGIIEPHKTPQESAADEALEEAGVSGPVGEKCLGIFSVRKWGGTCRVQVFPMKVTRIHDHWEEDDIRERMWVPLKGIEKYFERNVLEPIFESFSSYLRENGELA